MEWRKSSFSGTETNCVEIAHLDSVVGVRDSKNPTGGRLTIPARALRRLVDTVR